MPEFNEEKPKDVNMWLVGLGNTRILVDYVQKNSWTLVHMFENTSFEIEFGKPRSKNYSLDMCLTSKSSVSRLIPSFLIKTVNFQLQSKMALLHGLKPSFSIKVGNLLPWLTKLHFEVGVFKRVWPPLLVKVS